MKLTYVRQNDQGLWIECPKEEATAYLLPSPSPERTATEHLGPWRGTGPEPYPRFERVPNKAADSTVEISTTQVDRQSQVTKVLLRMRDDLHEGTLDQLLLGNRSEAAKRAMRRMMLRRLSMLPRLIDRDFYDKFLDLLAREKGSNPVTRSPSAVQRQEIENYWVQRQLDRQSFVFRFVEWLSLLPRPNLRFRDMVDYKGTWGSQVWWL